MKYDHAKPLIKELMHIAVLYHMSPGMLRTKIFDALKEFIPDMDDGCFERGCPAIDHFAAPVHPSDTSQERVDETAKDRHEWVEITKGECDELFRAAADHIEYAYAIEAKLKEKNSP